MKKLLTFVVAACVAASVVLTAQTKPLTNADIVSLAKLAMGDDVIIAKINQAAAVDFKLEVADLEALKKAGVTNPVISAMLKKSTAKSEPAPAAAAKPASGGGAAAPAGNAYQAMGAQEADTVYLLMKDGKRITIRSMAGTMSSTYAYVTMLMHSNFEGLKADARTTDRRPSLILRSTKSPKGRMWFVSAEVDAKNNVRSVKMGNSKIFGAKNIGAPDSSNQIECDVVAEGPDTWRITPKKDLKPGEYGIWMNSNEMFDFGIDG